MKTKHKNTNYSKETISNDNLWKRDRNDSQIRGVLSYPNSDKDVAEFPYIQIKRGSLQSGKTTGNDDLFNRKMKG